MDLMELVNCGATESIGNLCWTQQELNRQNEDGRTALMQAAINGNYQIIEVLKAAGADLDLVDKDGLKAVHHAARNGHGMAIIYLIEGGCGG